MLNLENIRYFAFLGTDSDLVMRVSLLSGVSGRFMAACFKVRVVLQ